MQEQIIIRCYEALNDFLPVDKRASGFPIAFDTVRSVKDLIESVGIPHPEVDLIIIDGNCVNFDYQVRSGDHISLYPATASGQLPTLQNPYIHCQPARQKTARFVLDVHLGKLAAFLRMLGFDTLYKNDYDDPELADISADEHRILLTCDRMLLMRKQVTQGYFVRNRQPLQQLLEILSRFDLSDKVKPFTRCMHCNGNTRLVNKRFIESQLLPKTKKYYDEFYQCDSCKKIYWKGSHYLKMQDMINKVKADVC